MKILSLNNMKIKLFKNDYIVIYVPDKKERLIIENLKDKIQISHFKNTNKKTVL